MNHFRLFWHKFNLRHVFVGISIIITIIVLTYVAYQTARPSTISSSIGFTANTKYTKVTPHSVLRFGFSEPVQRASAQEHFVAPENITGAIGWEEDTLTFTPDEPLTMQQEYAFTFTEGIVRVDSRPTTKELQYKFFVDGPPTITAQMPAAESVNIPSDASITIVFDRPMVPLAAVYQKQDTQLQNWPVTISPAIAGRWRWLGNSTVEFVPTDGFVVATNYTVTVPQSLQDTNGDSIAKEYSWSFETVRPKITATEPYEGFSQAGSKTDIVLTFAAPVNANTMKQFIEFVQTGTTNIPVEFTVVHGRKKVNNVEVVDKNVLVLVPKNKLTLQATYAVRIAAGALGAIGSLGMADDYTFTFQTAKPFAIQKTNKWDYGLQFEFNNPFIAKNVKNFITIKPEPANWSEYELVADEWGDSRYLSLHPDFAPSTTYTITVRAGLTDAFGQKLATDYSTEFTTPPLQPRVFIHSTGEFGIFERDKPPIYYLNSVNVSRLDVAMTPLALPDFITIQKNKQVNYSYAPDLGSYPNAVITTIAKPNPTKDTWQALEFNVQEKFGKKLEAGIYGVSLTAPEHKDYQNKPIIEQQYFVLTNMAITVKYTANSALVWVVDIVTGAPVQNALITFYSLEGTSVASGSTNADGFFEAANEIEKFVFPQSGNDPTFWITAQKNGDFAFVGSQWSNGIDPYNFGYDTDYNYANDPEYKTDVFMYTDRPLYRAGHEVFFKGIVRLRDQAGVLYPASTKRTVLVNVTDAVDKVIYEKTLPVSEFGTFNAALPIAEDASLGVYTIKATVLPEADIKYQYNTANFQVLAYRKPEYKTSIEFTKEDYFVDEKVTATIKGAYYFGGAMDGAKVTWQAISTDYFFNKYTDDWFSFSDSDSWCWWECERNSIVLTSGEGVLNAQGELQIEFLFTAKQPALSQIISIEATIADRSNQQVSTLASVPMHKANVYVGIRPENYGVEPGQAALVQLITLLPDGTPAANTTVDLVLYEQKWNTIRKKDVDGNYYWDNEVENTQLKESQVRTDAIGKARGSLVLPKGGSYKITAIAKDSTGATAKASTTVYAYSTTYFNWPRTNSDRIEITADKPEYAVGETAKLLVKSPYQGSGVLALVTLERETILQKFIVPVTSNALPIEVPITKDLVPNVYVSVIIVKPRTGETFNENGLDTGLPAFKMGLTRLAVETSTKEVTVQLTTDQKKYIPREQVTVNLKTLNAVGQPVAADVSLGVVDTSVLALTGFKKPDLVAYFYSMRPLSVRTAQMLLYMLERFKPGSKGGGGGDGSELAERTNFKDTAYWNPAIRTNEQGEATVTFTLPDNLTTWQLLAIANTKDSTFGAEAIEIIETKQVIVRPIRPRFAVHRDEITLGAIVHNFTNEKKDFTVQLSGSGFSIIGAHTAKVTVAPDGQQKVNFVARVHAVESAVLRFSAESGVLRDVVTETIPVYLFATKQTVATSGTTDAAVTEQIFVPNQKMATDTKVQVTVSPTMATYLPAGLAYLSEYAYGCSEQIMSKLLPNIALHALQNFSAFTYVDDASLQAKVVQGMQLLYPLQHANGGFGYFAGSTDASPSLTTYIVYGMQKAKEQGYTVDETVLTKGYAYLQSILRNPSSSVRPWEMSDALRAQILFTLGEGNQTDVQLLNNLYEKRTELPLYAQAFYVMALQKGGTAATLTKATTLLTEIKNTAKVNPRGIHFEEPNERLYRWSMNTNTRTSALVLLALVRGDPTSPLIDRTVRHLLSVRENGHWDTTQSTSFTLLAFTEFLQSTNELEANFVQKIAVNGATIAEHTFNQSNVLTKQETTVDSATLKEDALNTITIAKEGTGKLYYDLTMSYNWLAETIAPASEGMSITRTIEPVNPKDTALRAGSLQKVTLTLTVPEDRYQVAVESPLAAGFEAVDLQLKTEQSSLQDTVNKKEYTNWYDWWRDELRYFTHTEFRDDRVFLFADYLPAGVYKYEYIVRATVPGTFYERPAKFWEMYFPENFGQTAGAPIVIKDAE